MTKKKTIVCDRCGARIDYILEKCPKCGNNIFESMNPPVHERIGKKIEGRKPWYFYALLLIIFILICSVAVTIIIYYIFRIYPI